MKDIYCNVCGKKLFVEKGILKEDAFEAKKQWGYFSKKDGMLHSFVICEKCYDDMIEKLVIRRFILKKKLIFYKKSLQIIVSLYKSPLECEEKC